VTPQTVWEKGIGSQGMTGFKRWGKKQGLQPTCGKEKKDQRGRGRKECLNGGQTPSRVEAEGRKTVRRAKSTVGKISKRGRERRSFRDRKKRKKKRNSEIREEKSSIGCGNKNTPCKHCVEVLFEK